MNFDAERDRMVEQIASKNVKDKKILEAFRKVPRHLFLPENMRPRSYEDKPFPIGADQTISQPSLVAQMIEQLSLPSHARVLEVGTGSGYETALLAELVSEVYSVERIASLAESARRLLNDQGYKNIEVRVGDGTNGWPEKAPFDGILVAASAPMLPEPLLNQLIEGGRLIIPIGSVASQTLTMVIRKEGRFTAHDLCKCLFVPLIGKHAWLEEPSPDLT